MEQSLLVSKEEPIQTGLRCCQKVFSDKCNQNIYKMGGREEKGHLLKAWIKLYAQGSHPKWCLQADKLIFLLVWIYERSLGPFHLWCHGDAPVSASRLLHILPFSSECPGDIWLLKQFNLRWNYWAFFGSLALCTTATRWHLQKYIFGFVVQG